MPGELPRPSILFWYYSSSRYAYFLYESLKQIYAKLFSILRSFMGLQNIHLHILYHEYVHTQAVSYDAVIICKNSKTLRKIILVLEFLFFLARHENDLHNVQETRFMWFSSKFHRGTNILRICNIAGFNSTFITRLIKNSHSMSECMMGS